MTIIGRLEGYVAGQPFALLDPNDPDIATKIIWNNVFRPITTDDYDLRFFDCQEQYPKLGGVHRVINDLQIGHYAGYNIVGSTEVEPMPVDPDFQNLGASMVIRALSSARARGPARSGDDPLSLCRS